jgi:16S rRNA G966 N2-methylase RsmD
MGQLANDGRQFDLVVADPPFGEKNLDRRSTSFSQRLLDDPVLLGLLRPGGLLILGHSKRDQLTVPPAWVEKKLLKHGDSQFRFLEAAPPPA